MKVIAVFFNANTIPLFPHMVRSLLQSTPVLFISDHSFSAE
jgi:hypothetical protein